MNSPAIIRFALFDFDPYIETSVTPPAEVMIATQQRMFARRNVAQRACDAQLIHDMYDLTRHERQLAGEPLSL